MNHFRPSIVFLLREEVCRDGQNICEQQQQQHGPKWLFAEMTRNYLEGTKIYKLKKCDI